MTRSRWGVVSLLGWVTSVSLVGMEQHSTPSLPNLGTDVTLEDLNSRSPLSQKLGITFTELTVERVVATMPVDGNQQFLGLLHGGATLALAETLGSVAAYLHAGGRPVVGTELGASHLRSAREGVVTGTCEPIHLGSTLTTHLITVRDEQQRIISSCRMTNLILDPQRSQRSSHPVSTPGR